MTDVILVATIVAFFAAAALLVRALGHVVADSAEELGPEDYPHENADPAESVRVNEAGRPR
jgi:hypothetical protein